MLLFIDNSSTQLQHLSADQSPKTSAGQVLRTPEISSKLFSFFISQTHSHTHTMDDLFGVEGGFEVQFTVQLRAML